MAHSFSGAYQKYWLLLGQDGHSYAVNCVHLCECCVLGAFNVDRARLVCDYLAANFKLHDPWFSRVLLLPAVHERPET